MTAQSDAKSRARARRLRLAFVTSILSKVGSVAYLFIAIPLIIGSIGADGYSQFVVVIAAFGWVGPLFVGLGSAVTERIASDPARPVSIQTRGTFMTSLSVSGVLLAAFLLSGAVLLISRPPGEPNHTALVIAGLATGLGVAGGVFNSALLGLQRMQVTNVLSFGGSLVAVVATLIAALVAPTVGAMVLATLAPVAVGRAISAYMLHRAEPGLFGRFADIDLHAAPRIAGRGLVFAGISFASFLSLNAGLIVVAARLGTTQVAEVAVMVQLLPLALSIVGMIIVPLWPAIAEAAAEGDIHWIARAGGRAAALVMAYAIAAGLVVVLGGEKLVGIWTGGRIAIPFDILVAGAGLIIVASAKSVTQTMLFGLGRAGTVAAILLFQGFLSLTFVYLFTDALGQAAVLAGPIAAQLVTGSWLLPLLVVRGFLAHERLRPLSELGGPKSS